LLTYVQVMFKVLD